MATKLLAVQGANGNCYPLDLHPFRDLMLELFKEKQQNVFIGLVQQLEEVLAHAKYHFHVMHKVLAARERPSHKKGGTLKDYLSIRYHQPLHPLYSLIRSFSPPVFLKISQHVTFRELERLGDHGAFATDCEAALHDSEVDEKALGVALKTYEFLAEWADWRKKDKLVTVVTSDNLRLVVVESMFSSIIFATCNTNFVNRYPEPINNSHRRSSSRHIEPRARRVDALLN